MAVSLGNYKVKDATEWTPGDVREFIETILPGHPCIDNFTYPSGYVLCSLEKDDLRRQAHDEEAANVIWAELQGCKRATAPGSNFKVHQDRGCLDGPPSLVVYVRTRQEVALELEVNPADTIASVKSTIEEREGTPVDSQRLICNGINLQDDQTVLSCNIRHGAILLLVPQLKDQGKPKKMQFSAPRGMLMVPGSKSWTPAHPARPYMPILCSDTSRNFPVNLEFENTDDVQAFVTAANQDEAPVIEIHTSKTGGPPTETKVHLDPDVEGVRLDTMANTLLPSSRY